MINDIMRSIVDAFGQLSQLQFTPGMILVLGGLTGVLISIIAIIMGIVWFPKQRKDLFEKLKEGKEKDDK